MQKAIAYMEEHLMEEINYEDVAEYVHTSSYEFHRAFSFLSGMTANAYIRNRRVLQRHSQDSMELRLSLQEKSQRNSYFSIRLLLK